MNQVISVNLGETLWKNLFSDRILKRGLDYYKSGAVEIYECGESNIGHCLILS